MILWNQYHEAFLESELMNRFRRPSFSEGCDHNAHMYYILLKNLSERTLFIEMMKREGVNCVFHYVPLHNSSYGRKVARTSGMLRVTEDMSERLVRLPLWVGMENEIKKVIESVKNNSEKISLNYK
jgi:dTDP-4-amino-4,6-dideoxygalactose transaminase